MIDQCILQIDDDPDDVFLLKSVFLQAGISNPIQLATDSESAISYLTQAASQGDKNRHPMPCLIMLDIKLQHKTGLEVLAWIRQQPSLKRLVVIMFSSSALPEDIDRAYDLGANSFIEKPVNYEQSLELARLLKGWWLTHNQFASFGS
jgi:CheY-like chemotaxis protein